MQENLLSQFFEKSPIPYAYQRIILDEKGTPCDYEIIDINEAMANLFGTRAEALEGKRFREMYPEKGAKMDKWVEICGDVALNNKTVEMEIHEQSLNRQLKVKMFTLEDGYFASIFTDPLQEETLGSEELVKMIEELKSANQKLQSLAVTDELTGLYNRHFLEQKIEKEMERADRYNETLSLVIFDLDHFKRVNDTYGHPVGDEVLKKSAFISGQLIRSSDMLIRFGGEEFVMIMPQTSANKAILVAEKLREALEKNVHPQADKVTASFGVAERFKGESFKSWYKKADEALYQAKNRGRNCVFCYTRETMPVASVNVLWQNEWASGNQIIDDQHRELLDVANGLIQLSLSQVPRETVLEQIERLLQHIKVHFDSEIRILQDKGYPEVKRHALIHKELLGKANSVKESYRKSELKPSAFFSYIVDDIVVGHMLAEDTRFFPYILNADGNRSS